MDFFLLFVNDPAIPQLNNAFAVRRILPGVRHLLDRHAFIIQLAERIYVTSHHNRGAIIRTVGPPLGRHAWRAAPGNS